MQCSPNDQTKAIFTRIYNQNEWPGGSHETRSGIGSTTLYTRETVKFVEDFVKHKNVTNIVDLGCGEMHWQKEFASLPEISRYVGVDVVPSVIESNQGKIKDNRFTFVCCDAEQFNRYDGCELVICRETLFHLPIPKIMNIINQIRNSNCKWFLTTSDSRGSNRLVRIGGFFDLNLQSQPFSFPPPVEMRSESQRKSREMHLYHVPDLPEMKYVVSSSGSRTKQKAPRRPQKTTHAAPNNRRNPTKRRNGNGK